MQEIIVVILTWRAVCGENRTHGSVRAVEGRPSTATLQVAGTKAGATLSPFTLYTEEDGKELDKPLSAPSINSFDEEVKHFVGCIVDGKEPISSAEQGIMLMQMLDGIYESAEKGRSVPIADLSAATG